MCDCVSVSAAFSCTHFHCITLLEEHEQEQESWQEEREDEDQEQKQETTSLHLCSTTPFTLID